MQSLTTFSRPSRLAFRRRWRPFQIGFSPFPAPSFLPFWIPLRQFVFPPPTDRRLSLPLSILPLRFVTLQHPLSAPNVAFLFREGQS